MDVRQTTLKSTHPRPALTEQSSQDERKKPHRDVEQKRLLIRFQDQAGPSERPGAPSTQELEKGKHWSSVLVKLSACLSTI
ncbi:unnamed protein product [Gongylonema pulchrum]|uniref:Uncharacterized protein n=1 Tax=Gongylonema pulchrum TaxID=637853 RepID=A0A183D7I8_9BILA|nr:unnamed protein product [Gongylonema pulchrum]